VSSPTQFTPHSQHRSAAAARDRRICCAGCTAASVSATQPQDYDLTPANDAAHAQDVASWREAVAAQDGEVDAILGGSPSANPKSIAVT
jgi:hypothetical protein